MPPCVQYDDLWPGGPRFARSGAGFALGTDSVLLADFVQPCHSDEFPSKATRPSYSVLDKTKFKNTFGIAVPYWTDALRECLKNMNR